MYILQPRLVKHQHQFINVHQKMVVLIINCHDKQVEYFFFFSLQIKGGKNPQGKRDMGNENMKTGILLILIFHHALTQQSLMPFNYLTRLNCK